MTQAVAEAACTTIGADCGVLYLYHADPLAFDVRNIGTFGLLHPDKELSTKDRGETEGLATFVLNHAEALVVDDVDSGWDRHYRVPIYPEENKFLQREEVKAFVGFPLIGGEFAMGVLIVSFRSPHRFAQAELDGLEVLVQQATVSLSQARLSLRAHKNRRMSVANREITALLGTTKTTRPVWKAILDGALDVTGAKRGCILLTDPDGQLRPTVQRGFDATRRRHLKDLARGACAPLAHCARTAHPCLIHDLCEDPRGCQCCQVCPATRSLLAAAIGRHDQIPAPGVLVVESDERAAFSEDDRELLQSLGEYGAIARESAERYAHLRRDARVFSGLRKTDPAVGALKHLDVALQDIADHVREILECDVVMLYPYEQEQSRIGFPPVQSGRLRDPKGVRALDYVDPDNVVGQLLRRGKAHFAEHSARDPVFADSDFVRRESVASTAAVPMLMGRERVGIVFANYRRPHLFSRQERDAIQLFAAQAAVTIHNARQFEATLREIVHRQALYEAAEAITGSLAGDQRSVLSAIVKAAVDVASAHGEPATLGVLQLLDKERNFLSFESVYPPDKEDALRKRQGDSRSLDKSQASGGHIGISGRAVLMRHIQRVGDVSTDPDYVTFDDDTRSELDVPLWEGGAVIGVLSVESPAKDAFSKDDADTLAKLAAMAVTALQVSRQARDLQRASTVAVMGAWSAEIGHAIQPQVGRIRWAVLDGLRHLDQPDALRSKLEEIDAAAGELDSTDIPAERPEPGTVMHLVTPPKVDPLVQSVVAELQGAYSGVSVECELGCADISVAMHALWLKNVLRGLISNAAKAIRGASQEGKVLLRTQHRDGQVQLDVEDSGPGLPPSLERAVLEGPVHKPDGHVGRGLVLARFLVEQYGGRIHLAWNHPGKGACFAVTIPIAQTAPVSDEV